MTPQTGQHVKVILRNGAIAEGIVEEWFANTVQLRSLDNESILIISHPAEDIMLIKVMLDKPEEEAEPESGPTIEEVNDFEAQFQEAADSTDPHDVDDIKSLAQLRIELNKQERRIIAEKLKDHRPGRAYQPSTTPYHYPSVVTGKPTPYTPSRIPNGHTRHSKKPSTK